MPHSAHVVVVGRSEMSSTSCDSPSLAGPPVLRFLATGRTEVDEPKKLRRSGVGLRCGLTGRSSSLVWASLSRTRRFRGAGLELADERRGRIAGTHLVDATDDALDEATEDASFAAERDALP